MSAARICTGFEVVYKTDGGKYPHSTDLICLECVPAEAVNYDVATTKWQPVFYDLDEWDIGCGYCCRDMTKATEEWPDREDD